MESTSISTGDTGTTGALGSGPGTAHDHPSTDTFRPHLLHETTEGQRPSESLFGAVAVGVVRQEAVASLRPEQRVNQRALAAP